MKLFEGKIQSLIGVCSGMDDPVNYNVPEGSYATDARHGEVRIREMKEMIQAIHEAGFGVIMDVVYNHTYSTGFLVSENCTLVFLHSGISIP